MTRLQKKCLVFSLGLHGLLAVIVFFSAAFRTRPENEDLQVLSMIPANILDRAGAGGGTPAPQPPQPQAPAPPSVTAPSATTVRVESPKPKEETREPLPLPKPKRLETPVAQHEIPVAPRETQATPRPAKPIHEIHVSYAPSATPNKKSTENSDAAHSSAAAELKRLKQVEASLSQLAAGVQSSGAEKTIVDVPGIGGGGEVFAGYKEIVQSIYYHAWITQDSVADRVAGPVARIVVARDGTILSAELVTPSGDPSLDKSVERALRAVTKLPPFPAGAREEERTFRIRFNLDAKKATG
jgi:periplasmic protein TonB